MSMKYLLFKVILAAFFIVFGIPLIKLLGYVIVILCGLILVMVILAIWWICRKLKGLFR